MVAADRFFTKGDGRFALRISKLIPLQSVRDNAAVSAQSVLSQKRHGELMAAANIYSISLFSSLV